MISILSYLLIILSNIGLIGIIIYLVRENRKLKSAMDAHYYRMKQILKENGYKKD